jgi:hypothetical protein
MRRYLGCDDKSWGNRQKERGQFLGEIMNAGDHNCLNMIVNIISSAGQTHES